MLSKQKIPSRINSSGDIPQKPIASIVRQPGCLSTPRPVALRPRLTTSLPFIAFRLCEAYTMLIQMSSALEHVTFEVRLS